MTPSLFDPAKPRHPCCLYDNPWAPEADREVRFLHVEPFAEALHTSLDSTPESINTLPCVAHCTNPLSCEFIEHCMVRWREVLGFVDQDTGKSWKCTSEQCGHIYLIVIINEPFICGFNRGDEEGIDGRGDERGRFLVE